MSLHFAKVSDFGKVDFSEIIDLLAIYFCLTITKKQLFKMTETEQKHSFELHALYKEILRSFNLYCLYQYKGKDLDIKNCNFLFEKLSRDYQAWQLLPNSFDELLSEVNLEEKE